MAYIEFRVIPFTCSITDSYIVHTILFLIILFLLLYLLPLYYLSHNSPFLSISQWPCLCKFLWSHILCSIEAFFIIGEFFYYYERIIFGIIMGGVCVAVLFLCGLEYLILFSSSVARDLRLSPLMYMQPRIWSRPVMFIWMSGNKWFCFFFFLLSVEN